MFLTNEERGRYQVDIKIGAIHTHSNNIWLHPKQIPFPVCLQKKVMIIWFPELIQIGKILESPRA
jgi:hypothetical protein